MFAHPSPMRIGHVPAAQSGALANIAAAVSLAFARDKHASHQIGRGQRDTTRIVNFGPRYPGPVGGSERECARRVLQGLEIQRKTVVAKLTHLGMSRREAEDRSRSVLAFAQEASTPSDASVVPDVLRVSSRNQEASQRLLDKAREAGVDEDFARRLTAATAAKAATLAIEYDDAPPIETPTQRKSRLQRIRRAAARAAKAVTGA